MTRATATDPAGETGAGSRDLPYHRQTESYGADHLQARHGRINGWLLLVYLVLFIWALHYSYVYWGGL